MFKSNVLNILVFQDLNILLFRKNFVIVDQNANL